MIVTEFTRETLCLRRARRSFSRAGYEEIDEHGGVLWELYRGPRQGHRIVDALVDPAGMSVWVRIEPEGGA